MSGLEKLLLYFFLTRFCWWWGIIFFLKRLISLLRKERPSFRRSARIELLMAETCLFLLGPIGVVLLVVFSALGWMKYFVSPWERLAL